MHCVWSLRGGGETVIADLGLCVCVTAVLGALVIVPCRFIMRFMREGRRRERWVEHVKKAVCLTICLRS